MSKWTDKRAYLELKKRREMRRVTGDGSRRKEEEKRTGKQNKGREKVFLTFYLVMYGHGTWVI